MQVIIRETNLTADLDYIIDGIDNALELCADVLEWDDDDEIHYISQDDYDWWVERFELMTSIDKLDIELQSRHGYDRVNVFLKKFNEENGGLEFEDYHPALFYSLLEEFEVAEDDPIHPDYKSNAA